MPVTVNASQDVRTATPRNIFASHKGKEFGRGLINATYAYDGGNTNYETVLREGCLMAKITADGTWVPCKRTKANGSSGPLSSGGSSDETNTDLVVDDASFFKAGDTITVGGTSATISSIDYSTNTITLASAIEWDNDDAVIAAGGLAGAETALAVLAESVDLYDEDLRQNVSKHTGALLIKGHLNKSALLGDADAILADSNSLVDAHITFAEDYGQA